MKLEFVPSAKRENYLIRSKHGFEMVAFCMNCGSDKKPDDTYLHICNPCALKLAKNTKRKDELADEWYSLLMRIHKT